jgi:hypothetical protein
VTLFLGYRHGFVVPGPGNLGNFLSFPPSSLYGEAQINASEERDPALLVSVGLAIAMFALASFASSHF